jgi:hypothetical protein
MLEFMDLARRLWRSWDDRQLREHIEQWTGAGILWPATENRILVPSINRPLLRSIREGTGLGREAFAINGVIPANTPEGLEGHLPSLRFFLIVRKRREIAIPQAFLLDLVRATTILSQAPSIDRREVESLIEGLIEDHDQRRRQHRKLLMPSTDVQPLRSAGVKQAFAGEMAALSSSTGLVPYERLRSGRRYYGERMLPASWLQLPRLWTNVTEVLTSWDRPREPTMRWILKCRDEWMGTVIPPVAPMLVYLPYEQNGCLALGMLAAMIAGPDLL